MYKKALLVILVFVGMVVKTEVGLAHANLVRSIPAAGEVLETSPQEIVLEFSETLDIEFTSIQILDSTNRQVVSGPGVIDLDDSHILRLAVDQLPNDSFTAIWQVRSMVDGHITTGSVPFGIGIAPASTMLIPPLGTPDPALERPSQVESFARWLNLLTAALTLGSLVFGVLVWKPTLQAATRTGVDYSASDGRMQEILQRLIIVGCGLSIGATFFLAIVQASRAADVSVATAFGPPLLKILGGYSGKLFLIRAGLFLLIGALIWWKPSQAWGSLIGLGGGVLLTFSLLSHAAAIGEGVVLAIMMDWLHLAGMVIWVGGLVPLAFALSMARRQPESALPLAFLIPRFSVVAVSSVAILSISGLYSYLLHINRLDLLMATTYGRSLLIKTALFVILFALGVINLFLLSPRLRARGNQMAVSFSRTVRTEVVIGALLLLLVGAMTSVAPARTAWEAHETLFVGMVREETVDDVQLTLRIAPHQVGNNEFAVDVADHRPGAEAVEGAILLRLKRLDADTGILQIETQTEEGQRFTARGSYLSTRGIWEIEVIARRPGFNDVRVKFEFTLPEK